MGAVESQQPAASTSASRPPWWKRLGRSIALYAVTPYLAVTLIFVVFQRQLIYRPTVADNLSAATVGLDPAKIRDVQIRTPDGETLHGWLLHPTAIAPKPAPKLVIYFPGNSLNRSERLNDLREIAACGFDVLIFDYRGYGDSTGYPSEPHQSADAKRIWDFARHDLGYAEQDIVLFGESLGGAVALSLWSVENTNVPHPAAVILSSTFASLPQTAAWHYPLFPFRYFLADRWPSVQRIVRVSAPVVIFHGTDDEMIPIAQAQQLARAAPHGRFLEIPGAGHNDIPFERLRQELSKYAARH